MQPDRSDELRALFQERILFLDGAMGTMIQRHAPTEEDYRGTRFADHPCSQKGNNDLLSITQPQMIASIHRAYLECGCDILETNTFSAQRISMADYQMEDAVRELNIASAQLARDTVDTFMQAHPERPCFVAGSIGPTTRTLSLSPDVDRPGWRTHTFDQFVAAYQEQIEGLMEGGVDLILFETIIDTLNIKAGLIALEQAFEALGRRLPLIISMTIIDQAGRTLGGQTPEAFWTSVAHAKPLAMGINCALGPAEMRPFIQSISALVPTFVSCYPNAGLPNELGQYDLSVDAMARTVGQWAKAGWVNLVGGCCGTTPEYVEAIVKACRPHPPRVVPPPTSQTRYAGLEVLELREDANFTLVGERTNVTGSRKFARLIRDEDYEAAVSVALDQVRGGANILDVNMDEGMIDSARAMQTFLNILATEPEVARIPFMIDSSRFEVLHAGIKCVQGKAIVNSISLKEGEEAFIAQASLIKRFGAAMVVMAFDEEGQATTTDHKVAICTRAYHILVDQVGVAPEDIIFDANILTVATGIEEHNRYAIAYIEAVRRIKATLPGVRTIGGVSNISFSFRGNDTVREAIHAAFLYHAIKAGLDMGIVNAGQLEVYEEVEPRLLELVEDVLFDRRPDATERLTEHAQSLGKNAGSERVRQDAWRQKAPEGRLKHALMKGILEHMEEDLAEVLPRYPRVLDIIEGPLMDGMREVGDLFGQGKMFLPQVVKSARAMKKAVSFLLPYMEVGEAGEAKKQGKVLMATVKGDVHDIGKNIVGVVLACNNYEVIDLGVMVPAQEILNQARAHKVDMIGLSGLITPSLDEMVHLAKEMAHQGFDLPLLIGGATTSRKHTSIKIAPHYDHEVIHVIDASRVVGVANDLVDPITRHDHHTQNLLIQERDREMYATRGQRTVLPWEQARAKRVQLDWDAYTPPTPTFFGPRALEVPLEALVPYIDWTPFFITWEFRGTYPAILDHPESGAAARELFAHAKAMLEEIVTQKLLRPRGVYGFFGANTSDHETIELYADMTPSAQPIETLCMLRQQRPRPGDEASNKALSDFIAPRTCGKVDTMGAFAVSAGQGLAELVATYESQGDDYNAIMAKALADRLAEAFAEWMHHKARQDWGIQSQEPTAEDLIKERYRGIRPAPGYPACPDHTEKAKLWDLLEVEAHAGITLTESFAMWPAASVSGWYFAHPESHYFTVGLMGRDQIEAYAAHKQMPLKDIERWLAPYLGYEPE